MNELRENGERQRSTPSTACRRLFSLLILAAAVAIPIIYFSNLIRTVNDTEYKLHALRLTGDLIEEYMRTHHDEWPSSWDDLHDIQFQHRPPSMFDWPDDANELIDRVHIDFDLTENELAEHGFRITTAVSPIGEYVYDPMIRLQTLQDYIDSRREQGAFDNQ